MELYRLFAFHFLETNAALNPQCERSPNILFSKNIYREEILINQDFDCLWIITVDLE